MRFVDKVHRQGKFSGRINRDPPQVAASRIDRYVTWPDATSMIPTRRSAGPVASQATMTLFESAVTASACGLGSSRTYSGTWAGLLRRPLPS